MARGQLRVLNSLDVDRTRLYHLQAIVISGIGFFTDAYDFFAISLVIDLVCYQHYHRRMDRRVHVAINGIALCGAVPGQLVFGWLGDKMGQKRIYGVTLVLMVVTSLASGFSFSGSGEGSGKNVVVVLCFFRFWLGVSIGGDYPLSATIVSEYANKRRRDAFMAAAFAMQGLRNLAAGIVGMMVAAAFKKSAPRNTDYVWRIVLMFGAVSASLTYYWQMKMPETARYTALVAMDAKKAAADMSVVLHVEIDAGPEDDEAIHELARWKQYGVLSAELLRHHGVHLLGTNVCWLVLDVTFYSLNLFMIDIFTKVGLLPALHQDQDASPSPSPAPSSSFDRMIKITVLHTVIALCDTLPGYFFTVVLVDRIGRVRVQLLGFTMMFVCILYLTVPYDDDDGQFWTDKKHKSTFAVLYGITTFFANFGPNTTTLIVSAEIFPAWLCSTCHGVSGAFGKVGAIIGVFGFLGAADPDLKKNHVRVMLFALVGCNLVGLLFTLLLPESKGRALEEITGEVGE